MSHAAAPGDATNIGCAVLAAQRFGRHLPVSRHDLRAARHEMMILMMGEVAERCDECHTD
jgi:hypothetical protein